MGTRKFELTYQNDRVAFLKDCIAFPDGQRPSEYQLEIAGALDTHRYVAVKGPRRLGKSAIASWMALHAILTHHDIKVITIAPSWRQLKNYLWPEIHKWAHRVAWARIGRPMFNRNELITTGINLSSTRSAFPVTSDRPELVEGAHADVLAMIYDEAKAIPDPFWDAVEGSLAGGIANSMGLAISTPGLPIGRFYDIFAKRPGLDYWSTVSVTIQQAVAAGRVSQAWVDRRRKLWGESSVLFRTYVLGEFGQSDEVGLIPLADVEAAIDRWNEWQKEGGAGRLTAIGVDVGGGLPTSDQAVLAPIFDGTKVGELEKIQVGDRRTFMMELVGRIGGLIRKYKGDTNAVCVVVDAIGMGLGVLHRLNEMGYNAVGFNAAVSTGLLDRTGSLGYTNVRAASWGLMSDILVLDSGLDVCLPPDDQLIGDLIAPRLKRVTSQSKIVIDGKPDIKRRIGRSTDCGDAVIMGLVGETIMADVQRSRQTGIIVGREDVGDPGLWY